MPSFFEQQLGAQLTSIRDTFGTPGATYTAPDNSTVNNLSIRVQREPGMQTRENSSEGESQKAEIIVLAADLPNPVVNGRFAVAGENATELWTIETAPLAQNGEFICTCTRRGATRVMSRHNRQ